MTASMEAVIDRALERELPSATLLLGQDVKRLMRAAHRAVCGQGALLVDSLVLPRVNAVDARCVVSFASSAPFGPFKSVIACLDGASAQAQNILLKALEEPFLLASGEPAVRFILVASSRPLQTIMSRCHVLAVPGESAPSEADQKAVAQGTAALNAVRAGDLRGLEAALGGWGDVQHAALTAKLAETAAGDGPDRAQARRLLGVLGRFEGAQPRLAAHAALVTVMCDREKHD